MKAFQSIQPFASVYLCATPAHFTRAQRVLNAIFSLIIIGSMTFDLVASILYLTQFFKTDLDGALTAASQTSGLSCSVYSMIALFLNRNKVTALIDECQTIYDTGTLHIYI